MDSLPEDITSEDHVLSSVDAGECGTADSRSRVEWLLWQQRHVRLCPDSLLPPWIQHMAATH